MPITDLVGEQTRPAPPIARMTPIELVAGWVFGFEAEQPTTADLCPRLALEQAVVRHVATGPIHVAFSGGRDSSVVLAVAVHIARRMGAPHPRAVTLRYPDVPSAEESAWQELVIEHLGVRDWEIIDGGPDLDLLAPPQCTSLRDHGVVWPPSVHRNRHLYSAAAGVLLTGEGGDEVFRLQRASFVRAFPNGAMRRPKPALRSLVEATGPKARRKARHRRTYLAAYPWLARTRREEVAELHAHDAAEMPIGWATAMQQMQRRRATTTGLAICDAIAAGDGCTLRHPLRDPGFLGALARRYGFFGPAGRTAALRELASDLLPDALFARRTKAYFNGACFREHSRAFVERWDGSGLEGLGVDVEALRREWATPEPSGMTYALLQQTWLASEGA